MPNHLASEEPVAGKPTEVTALPTSTSISTSVTPHDESPHNISAGLSSASDEDVRPWPETLQ